MDNSLKQKRKHRNRGANAPPRVKTKTFLTGNPTRSSRISKGCWPGASPVSRMKAI